MNCKTTGRDLSATRSCFDDLISLVMSIEASSSQCNDTCCSYEGDQVICFTDYNFTDQNELEVTPTWELAVRWTIVIPMVIFGVFGNLTIIVILLKNRLLMRTSVNIFILNMAISDMILAVAGPIPFTIRSTHQFWVLGELWCHLDGLIQVTVMQVSVTSLAVISTDRLRGIFSSKYQHLRRWKAYLIMAAAWIFSSLLGVPFYIYRNYGIHEWADLTEVYCEEVLTKTKYYWMVIIILLNWIPLLVMTTSYILLFKRYKKRAMLLKSREHPVIIRTKKRFVNMLFVMIVAFAVCWLPFQAFIMYREKIIFSDEGQVKNDKVYSLTWNITQYIVYLYPVVDPFIYGFMHQNFKYGFRVTFPCFFKDEEILVLMPGQGSRAYVWNRTNTGHRVPTHLASARNQRQGHLTRQPPLRRAFSFSDADTESSVKQLDDDDENVPSVRFQRSTSDASEYTLESRHPSRRSSHVDSCKNSNSFFPASNGCIKQPKEGKIKEEDKDGNVKISNAISVDRNTTLILKPEVVPSSTKG